MKYLIFSSPMVQALLARRKSMTRRLVKPQPPARFSRVSLMPLSSEVAWADDAANESWPGGDDPKRYWLRGRICVGDIFGVRENWATHRDYDHIAPKRLSLDAEIWYAADGDKPAWCGKTRPSIHIPEKLIRLFYRVTEVKVERANAISEADAIAEGVQTERDYYGGDVPLKCQGSVAWHRYDGEPCAAVSARHSFETLWKSIHGPDSWAANPWVWCYRFEKCERPTP